MQAVECPTIQGVPVAISYFLAAVIGIFFFFKKCCDGATIVFFKKYRVGVRITRQSLSSFVMVAGVAFLNFYYQKLQLSFLCVRKVSTVKNKRHRKSSYDAVNCETVPIDTEPHFTRSIFPQQKKAIVDYAPWSPWMAEKNFAADSLFQQIMNVESNEAFIDVGANIGQMTLAAVAGGKITYAFDPLEYDMKKICTGIKESLNRSFITQEGIDRLHLYRALVGNDSSTNTSITRPDDAFGRFEQASIVSDTIGVVRKPQTYVKEYVPMMTLDEVIPSHVPIGLLKIDVQGFEWPVVQGMKGLLERETGYPKIIHYEEQPRVTQAAGFQLGTVQAHLETYGYNCKRVDKNDIDCIKD